MEMEQGDSTKRKLKKIKQMNPKIDRISNLPEPVFHHILSFLHMIDVVRTSVLSTKWRYVWKSLPFLNFDYYSPSSKITSSGKRFEKFVDMILLLRDTSDIQSFSFSNYQWSIRFYDMSSPLDSWILTALKRNVQQIYLDLHLQYPSCLFNCSSLTTLKLTGIAGLDLPNSMSLPSLKTLVFKEIYFHADADADNDYIFSKVFSSCPVLESLTLKFCEFHQTDIEICALKLKHLKIENIDWGCEFSSWNEKSIKLSAPNLISFYWKDEVSTNCSINNFSALVEADIHMEVLKDVKEEEIQLMMEFLRALHNVESLRLTPKILEVIPKARALLESKPIQFCNLRCLKLRTWLSSDTVEAVTYLLKISPNIESLILELDYYKKPPTYVTYPYWDKVMSNSAKLKVQQKVGVSLQCKLYHLKSVQIRGFEGRLNEIMFLEVVLKNAMVLETLELHTCEAQISPRKKIWLSKLNENLLSFPRASSSIAISLL